MNLRPLLLVAFLSATVSSAHADALDDYIRADMKARHIPAIVFGVFKDGRILRSGAYGLANVELQTPATVANVFEIGSVSKQFTATLILMLLEQGRLRLDDRIDTYLGNLPGNWRAVTIRQLLNHTSGIPDIEEIFGYDSYRNLYTVDQIIAVANSKPVDFPAGTKWHYSNTGYYLLALILQKIEGKPYGEILQSRILDPLGMTHTRQSDPGAIIANRAEGYQRVGDGLGNRDAMQPTACLGAGTIVSTIGDMAKWDAAINHNRFLKPETQRLMWEKTKLPAGEANYGFAWVITTWRGHPCVEHSGGTAGFSCDYRRFQDLGLSVMVFSNLYATGVDGIEIRAVNAVHPGLSYVSAKPIADDPKIHTMLLKAMDDVAQGRSNSPYITPSMEKLYTDASHQIWKSRLADLKSFDLLEHTRYAPMDPGTGEKVVETYVYRLRTTDQTLFVMFMLTPDGRIGLQTRVEN